MERSLFPNRFGRFYSFVFIILLFAGVSTLASARLHFEKSPTGSLSQLTGVRVVRVIDGDTMRLSNKERVRLIGVDTPELHESAKLYRDAKRTGQDIRTIQRMGREAHQFTRKLVEGRVVRLEFDVQRRDKYGRLLAYVYLEDGTFVNAQIIKKGYAYPMTIPPNTRHAEEFRASFIKARRAGVGLWSPDHFKDSHE